jgi:hypothetical protein
MLTNVVSTARGVVTVLIRKNSNKYNYNIYICFTIYS